MPGGNVNIRNNISSGNVNARYYMLDENVNVGVMCPVEMLM